MRFSVIIPCYNASNTIECALDSLLSQSFDDYEIICVNDCSTDNTSAVILAYKDQLKSGGSRITLIQNECKSGPGIARNKGISLAKGDYLCFLDADDYYDPKAFQILDRIICKTNPDIVFYGCNQIIGNTIRKRPAVPRTSLSDYMALSGGSLWGGLWRRSLWKDLEIPAISNAEDIAVIPVLISRASNIISISDLLYNYVHSNYSTSSHHDSKVSFNFIESFRFTLQHVSVESFHDPIEFHGIKTIIYGATLNAIKAGMGKQEVLSLCKEFELGFPSWEKNEYLQSYPFIKRLFVLLVAHKCFFSMRLFARLHNFLLNKIG